MSILTGDSGKSAVGTLKTFNFNYPTPRENLLGSPLALPTTEPATAQISYTILDSDLPTISPLPKSLKYTASIIAGGKVNATASIINYRILKNGSSVISASTSSVSINTFWTETFWRFFDVQVGDLLEVKIWCSTTDANFDYMALMVYPTQVIFNNHNTILKDLTFTIGSVTLSLGVPNIANTGNTVVFPSTTPSIGFGFFNGTVTIPAITTQNNLGLFKMNNGDFATPTTNHSATATQRPSYQRNSVPSVITFREVLR